jgi:hypothetical protein
MGKKFAQLFFQVDGFLFEQIDKLKTTPSYIKFSEQISALDEEIRSPLNQLITLILILVPLALVVLFKWSNLSVEETISQKNEILSMAKSIKQVNNNLASRAGRIIALKGFSNLSEMSNRVRNIMTSSGVDLKKVKVIEFTKIAVGTSILKSTGEIQVSQMTMPDLKNALQALTQKEKFRVDELNLGRSNKNKLLSGKIKVVHFGKGSTQE